MIAPAQMQNWRLSPTDLVYLFEDCKRCFFDKIKNGLQLPWAFSPHFTNADRAMRRAIGTLDLVDLGVGPKFRVITQGEWIESQAIPFPDLDVSLSFRGQIDALVFTEDEEVFVADYKTTTLDDLSLAKFARQLSAYTLCIERPARKNSSLPQHVDGMALLVFDPATFVFRKDTKRGGLYGSTRWVELPRRNEKFDAFLSDVAMVLANDVAPASSPKCGICRLRFEPRLSVTTPVFESDTSKAGEMVLTSPRIYGG